MGIRQVRRSVLGVVVLTLVGSSSAMAVPASGAAPQVIVSQSLYAVSMLSPTEGWAVGSQRPKGGNNRTLAEHWNGTAWTTVTSTNPAKRSDELDAVAEVSSSDVWAVGEQTVFATQGGLAATLIEHWDGTAWTTVPNNGITGSLESLSVVSPTDIWAVGSTTSDYKTLVEHWDGTSWSVVASPNPDEFDGFHSVDAFSATDAWAAGYASNNTGAVPLLAHWDGTSWSPVQVHDPRWAGDSLLYGVGGSSATDVWVVGTHYARGTLAKTMVDHWNGVAWSRAASPSPEGSAGSYATSVSADATNDAWTVVNLASLPSNARLLHWNGDHWTNQVGVAPKHLYLGTVATISPTDAIAVGTVGVYPRFSTFIEQWDGHTWTRVQ